MRRRLAWLVALPLVVAGSQLAHVFAYRWVYPSAHVRMHVLLSSGHGYMAWLPLVFGMVAAAVLVSLLVAIVDAAHGRSVRALPAWAFALLPLATFVLQEILERSLHTGTFFWQAVESPTFVPGIILQLPFAAAAYLIAWLLLRTATALGNFIVERRHRRPLRALRRVAFPLPVQLPRPTPMAAAAAGRAPPLPLRS